MPPFFGRRERGIDEALREIELATLDEVLGEHLEDVCKYAGAVQLLEAVVAR
jgi:hypothetical protein